MVNNYFTTVDQNNNEVIVTNDLNKANFTNCIIDGNQDIEFILDRVEGTVFDFNVKNSMLKFDTNDTNLLNNPLFDFTDVAIYQNIILNGIPNFKNTNLNNLIIGQDSEAIENAEMNTALSVPFDILGVSRTTTPDIGAYQHITFEEEN